MSKAIAFLILALMLAGAPPALAHRLKVFAAQDGTEITGFAYFVGGDRATGIAIRIVAADGAEHATLTTDALGQFAFTPETTEKIRVIAESGDGHQAEIVLGGASAPVEQAEGNQTHIEQAVARQIRPLREQLDALEAKLRFQDIIGGLGYILGAAGLWALIASRRTGK